MVSADFLARFGIFVRKGFLDAENCKRLRNIIAASPGRPAIVADGNEESLDPYTRQTTQITVDDQARNEIRNRLLEIKPDLEKHFGVSLKDCELPRFLFYQAGDFFARHRDKTDNPNLSDAIKNRQVSVIILLSGGEMFSGGALTFYDLIPDPRLKMRGFPLQAEEGLLVAFSSQTLHEVQPVTSGIRYSVVTWFI
jgi:predicted 2-oxoglutarate/Fe(II)-dependent dioxygenase YbiX